MKNIETFGTLRIEGLTKALSVILSAKYGTKITVYGRKKDASEDEDKGGVQDPYRSV